ncbi:MAG: hypothetical protein PHV74_00165 [Dehalococcoidia bacterium]|nr:hypothetical protein [Dehalococcoidia bacterium]
MGFIGGGSSGSSSGYGVASYGFGHEIWFSREGYTPHYAEHIIDPLDGRAKLIMADPHTRKAAFVYDLGSKKITWEQAVNGSAINNPHTARMLMADVPNFGNRGDIYCCNRDQQVIVFDRNTGTIKKTITLSATGGQWDPNWLHEACLSVDPVPHLILTDYNGPSGYHYAKYKISDGTLAWHKDDFGHASKVCPIKGAHASLHTPDYGGDYLICSNEFHGGVWEIKDSDGGWTWARPRDRQGPSLVSPHSAIRMGRVENVGWITVVGCESGGGIIAIHFMGAPIWGIGNRAAKTPDGASSVYTVDVHGLGEICMVFPTIDGRIGFIDWNGIARAQVGVLDEIPQKQHIPWQLDWNINTTNDWKFLEYVPVADWDETYIVVKNTGLTNTMEWKVLGGLLQAAAYNGGGDARPEDWVEEKAPADLAPGGTGTHKLTRPYQYILVMYKSKVEGAHTTVSTFFDHLRG